ncbi:MAG: phage tail protein [Desulfocapsa sp.]|uniref:Phage tail protein n=1 Tax=Desulfotalea psychrophila TaxID=84980 RepID=A0ABS3ATG5_9BACT|nr:phage tail protein [Desulfocapsa sp.]MBN4045962.1 phage tail protein [bacterium AH-315-P11]MBN4068071.1 phage tail protein [Desulfotalea psychrophila]
MILALLLKKLHSMLISGWELLYLTFYSWTNLRHIIVSFRDGINPYGRVHFKKYIEATGEVTYDGWHWNLVVGAGKAHIADQLAERNEAQMAYMAIGTGTTGAVDTDTALENELDRNPLDSRVQGTGADTNKVTYTCTWDAGDGTGAITEAGIFNSAAAGQMLCRSVFAVKNKEAGEAMVQTWILTISA